MRKFLCGLVIIVPSLLLGGLSGTYVIGEQGGADYSTFTQGASALQSQGVTGPFTPLVCNALTAKAMVV